MLTKPRSKAREVAVGRYQAEAVESPAIEQVHGIDDECDVCRILLGRIGDRMLRQDGKPVEDLDPSFVICAGEVTIDSPHARFPDLGDLFKQAGRDARRGVVRIYK